MRHDYHYSRGSGTYQIRSWRVFRPDPTEDNFRLDLGLVAYKNGDVDGVTYPSFWFKYKDFPPDALAEFCYGKTRALTVLDWYDCRPEEREKFFGADFGGEKNYFPGETLRNLICADGEVKAVLNGPFRYVGKHALGKDEKTALNDEDVQKAREEWAKLWDKK